MPKLTDAQLVILSATAQRDDGATLPVPKSIRIKGAALTKTLEGLCKKGLVEERPAPLDAEAWREAEDGRRMTLVITEAGLEAINAEPSEESRKKPAQRKAPAKKPGTKHKTVPAKPKGGKPGPTPRQGTKQALVIGLLARKRGATIDEMVKATGWQPHSVRAALTGLRKRGIEVTRERKDGVTTYRAGAS